ncbi:hypothetical protein [Microbacterium candidum]|uniref:PEGA domain-containing protein n=1 Tax=Microbacterium candidum TaxID=3041922 RepID=A0ABT7N225_9MICO|nr:hypothetical protein [Microbacterium sp. ASV49]MDL9980715.1 hypothetical protein [Microbacterium sp. ASV49]
MPATLTLAHTTIGAEVRRGRYDILVDGKPAGSVEMNETVDIPVEAGSHTLKVTSGKDSSPTKTFSVADGGVVRFRATGKSFLPVFLLSFVVRGLRLNLKELKA